MSDKDIQQAVLLELDWEPLVRSTDIGVAVREGVVALSGFVDSYDQKYHAEKAAKRVYGVKAVANDLEVQLREGERSDPDIAHAVVSALEAHSAIPSGHVKVTVRDGWVTLEGQVGGKYQSEAAAAAVRYLAGVKGVENMITVKPHVSSVEVKHRIEEALHRAAALDARQISVGTTDSKVILWGTVRTWTERQEAEQAAWRAPGVSTVENHIEVVP
jgi:osmotically-inducible protein OsmY